MPVVWAFKSVKLCFFETAGNFWHVFCSRCINSHKFKSD